MLPIPVSRRGWLSVCCFAILMAAVFVLPYLLAHTLAKPGTVYTGLLINVEDGSYLSIIEQGRQGNWTYRNLFTSESHQPAFIQGFYLSLGHLGRLFGLSTVATWHTGLFIANLIFFITLYGFLAHIFPNLLQRHVAYALIILGGGFDWLPFPPWLERPNTLEAVPVDLFMPEVHPFFSSLTYPHFIAGVTLIMLTLWFTFAALTATPGSSRPRRQSLSLAVAAGLTNLLLAIVYPFLLLLIAGVLAVYYLLLLWQTKQLLWAKALIIAIVFAIPLPLLIYYASVLMANPIMRRWNAQAVTLSPNPLHFILAYLPYLLLALLTLRLFKKPAVPGKHIITFLWVWVVVAFALLYTPVNPQRRFVEGLQIPLAILATISLFEWSLPWLSNNRLFRSLAQRPRYSLAGLQKLTLLLLISTISLIHLFIYTATLLSLTGRQAYPLFRPAAELEAAHWLQQHTGPDDVILSSYWTGSWLPSSSGNRVVVGHLYETAFFSQKLNEVEQFFSTTTPDQSRQQLLARYQVTYLFWGRAEQQLGQFDPTSATYLQPVFENDELSLYQVQPIQE